ncbi:unnamed protein product [Soboliphyme baturini]|uniref:Copper transport protein n=1 Tax=Soboliphyme baturini TaxID=241478 RepID=A0A183IQI3_9BILA|nr:unnamed protein product [Soboliphyme baturini]
MKKCFPHILGNLSDTLICIVTRGKQLARSSLIFSTGGITGSASTTPKPFQHYDLGYESLLLPKEMLRPNCISWSHLLQTLLQMLQIVISYFLMLIFMTYNVWLCLAIVVGSGVGYFLFGFERSPLSFQAETCH